QGLYLTSWGQLGASGDQLDLTPARQQLDSAYQLSDSLSQSAADHNADALDAREHLKQAGEDADDTYGNSEQLADAKQDNARGATDSGGRGEAARMKAPWLHMASPAGITMSTPESTHLAQGRSLSVSSGEDVNVATGKSLVASISEKLSLFVQKAGIKLFAARGKVDLQAQSDNLEATARRDLGVTSTEDKIDFAAAKEILLVSGGAYVRIKGGDIELHAPGKVTVKGATKNFGGPASLNFQSARLPHGYSYYDEQNLFVKPSGRPLPSVQTRTELHGASKIEFSKTDHDGRGARWFAKTEDKGKVSLVADKLTVPPGADKFKE
uniref:DUF2345 domain-containing protein n=1 Tax=Salinicola sp. RZ23 TaxID=1949087 RepID=UPI001E2C6D63